VHIRFGVRLVAEHPASDISVFIDRGLSEDAGAQIHGRVIVVVEQDVACLRPPVVLLDGPSFVPQLRPHVMCVGRVAGLEAGSSQTEDNERRAVNGAAVLEVPAIDLVVSDTRILEFRPVAHLLNELLQVPWLAVRARRLLALWLRLHRASSAFMF